MELTASRTRLAVEDTHVAEIDHVQEIARNRHALGRVQQRLGLRAVDELQRQHLSVGAHLADEAVLVFGRRIATDVADEIDVLIGVVDDGLQGARSQRPRERRRACLPALAAALEVPAAQPLEQERPQRSTSMKTRRFADATDRQ